MNREIADDISGDLPKYPSLEEYKNRINSLLTLPLNQLSYEEISRVFYEKTILFQQAFGENPPEYFNQRAFYRVRFNIPSDENTDLLKTHSYPPAVACKHNGRANLKGNSVFYCSEHAGTAIQESKPNPGDIGYLSVWEGNSARKVKYGICLPKNLRTENIFHQMAQDIDAYLKQEATKCAGGKADHLIFLYQFIADRFVNETCPYSLTSWIANEMLFQSKPKDYIIYPSVANFHYACNLAFHPNSADTLLRFKRLWRFELIEIDGQMIRTADHKIGELDGSHMKWRNPNPGELQQLMPSGRYY